MTQPAPPNPEDDENTPLVRNAKLFGRTLGWMFVGYLVFSLGQLAKLW